MIYIVFQEIKCCRYPEVISLSVVVNLENTSGILMTPIESVIITPKQRHLLTFCFDEIFWSFLNDINVHYSCD